VRRERERERETKQSNIRLNECVCVEIEGVVCVFACVPVGCACAGVFAVSSVRLLECQESSLYYLLIQIQSNSCAEQEGRVCVNM